MSTKTTKSSAGWRFDGPKEIIDSALEFAVIPSFTKIGPAVRRKLFSWEPIRPATNRRIIITGANSGIGFAAATQLAAVGADVTIVARNRERGEAAVEKIDAEIGASVSLLIGDLSSLDSVRSLSAELLADARPIDALLHNAGALHNTRQESVDGYELTLATHVIGPFLMTHLLRPLLAEGDDARIVTMTSGGLYGQGISLTDLQTTRNYSGTLAYARAKRAQLLLNERWTQELDDDQIAVYTMHPGWVATPGVSEALPGFDRLLGPLLRDPDDGAETLSWLATEPTTELGRDGLWLDRDRRPRHRLPATRSADAKANKLWDRIGELAGLTEGH